MLQSGALASLWDEVKVSSLEDSEEPLSTKELKRLELYRSAKPVYDAVISALYDNVSDQTWDSPESFIPVITRILSETGIDKKTIDKVSDGLSFMDKTAKVQRDKKGVIIYDKDSKDTEIVKMTDDIESYMSREVLPHVPDAKWFFEENITTKTPVIKTGAEIPFSRYFYNYSEPVSESELKKRFAECESMVSERVKKLFGGV